MIHIPSYKKRIAPSETNEGTYQFFLVLSPRDISYSWRIIFIIKNVKFRKISFIDDI